MGEKYTKFKNALTYLSPKKFNYELIQGGPGGEAMRTNEQDLLNVDKALKNFEESVRDVETTQENLAIIEKGISNPELQSSLKNDLISVNEAKKEVFDAKKEQMLFNSSEAEIKKLDQGIAAVEKLHKKHGITDETKILKEQKASALSLAEMKSKRTELFDALANHKLTKLNVGEKIEDNVYDKNTQNFIKTNKKYLNLESQYQKARSQHDNLNAKGNIHKSARVENDMKSIEDKMRELIAKNTIKLVKQELKSTVNLKQQNLDTKEKNIVDLKKNNNVYVSKLDRLKHSINKAFGHETVGGGTFKVFNEKKGIDWSKVKNVDKFEKASRQINEQKETLDNKIAKSEEKIQKLANAAKIDVNSKTGVNAISDIKKGIEEKKASIDKYKNENKMQEGMKKIATVAGKLGRVAILPLKITASAVVVPFALTGGEKSQSLLKSTWEDIKNVTKDAISAVKLATGIGLKVAEKTALSAEYLAKKSANLAMDAKDKVNDKIGNKQPVIESMQIKNIGTENEEFIVKQTINKEPNRFKTDFKKDVINKQTSVGKLGGQLINDTVSGGTETAQEKRISKVENINSSTEGGAQFSQTPEEKAIKTVLEKFEGKVSFSEATRKAPPPPKKSEPETSI